jgi:uncharacterized protein
MSYTDIGHPNQITGRHTGPDDRKPVFQFLLVKLASRCNINCTYCYWFRDAEVYKKPAVFTKDAEDAFCKRLEEHIREHDLKEFLIIFHGGEPLLFPKHRFVTFQKKLDAIEERTGCMLPRGVSTNAILIDEEWAKILKEYNINVSVSIDGPPEIHDKYRIDMKGKGSHADTIAGVENLTKAGIEPGFISVCNPDTDPAVLLKYVVEELGVKNFDVLPPDATHEDNPPPIHDYFIKLFDTWYDNYAVQGVRISTIDAMIQGLIGDPSGADTIGLGPIETVTLMTDGTLEPLDVLRIIGDGSTKTDVNVATHSIQDVQKDLRWSTAYQASLDLCDTCKACEYFDCCGGGHLAQRWSNEKQYDNPSVYCESWKKIFDHMWNRISPTLVLEPDGPIDEYDEDMEEFSGEPDGKAPARPPGR